MFTTKENIVRGTYLEGKDDSSLGKIFLDICGYLRMHELVFQTVLRLKRESRTDLKHCNLQELSRRPSVRKRG